MVNLHVPASCTLASEIPSFRFWKLQYRRKYLSGRTTIFGYIRLCTTVRLDEKFSIFGVAYIAHVGIIYTP
jgi:hypothetical protein